MGWGLTSRLWVAYLILLVLFSSSLVVKAQRIDLSSSGELDAKVWRNDIADYRIDGGWLSLQARNKVAGRKLVSLTVNLASKVRWRGVVRLSALPSIRNHAYILLGCYNQQVNIGEYDYLALSIGGGRRESVALVELKIRNKERTPWLVVRERVLIETHQKPDALARGGVRFAVDYDREQGQLALMLEDYEQPKVKLIESSTRWLEHFEPNNSFGVLCVYTASRYNGFHFAQLSIDTPNDVSGGTGDNEPDRPITPEPELIPPLLSEVMASPLPACPEYIELYNPNDVPLSLDGYSLMLMTGSTSRKRLPLEGLSIAPKAFLVLTTSPEALQTTYPAAPRERLVSYNLPTLPNEAFRLSLYADDRLIDALSYSRQDFPKGLKTKKGVAWERSALKIDAAWRVALGVSAYATPGSEPSEEKESDTQEHTPTDEDEGLNKILERAAQERALRPVLLVADFAGRTLIRLEGRKAIDAVTGLADGARRLPLLGRLSERSGVLVFYLENSKTNKVEERWTMKFVCR